MRWKAILSAILCDMMFLKKIFLRRSAVERKTEIMGEAINRILKIQPDFPLPNARAIIDTRNRISHGYDSVKPDFLWSLVMRHIPALKKDVERIIDEYGISPETI